jgi:putative membrane protein
MPSIHIKNVGTVIIVAIVYSLINFFTGWFLVLLTLPLVIITFGLFKFVINAFLLWITDKLIEDFKIDSFRSTLIAAFLITVIDSVLEWLV